MIRSINRNYLLLDQSSSVVISRTLRKLTCLVHNYCNTVIYTVTSIFQTNKQTNITMIIRHHPMLPFQKEYHPVLERSQAKPYP